MSGLFSKPKVPEVKPVEPLPPPPSRSSEETQSLAESQRAKFFRRSGRASTMLTGGGGTEGGSFATRYLGGSART